MTKVLGVIMLVVGSLVLYFGWSAHEAVGADGAVGPVGDAGSAAVWLLTLGAVAVVLGLAALLRRRVRCLNDFAV